MAAVAAHSAHFRRNRVLGDGAFCANTFRRAENASALFVAAIEGAIESPPETKSCWANAAKLIAVAEICRGKTRSEEIGRREPNFDARAAGEAAQESAAK